MKSALFARGKGEGSAWGHVVLGRKVHSQPDEHRQGQGEQLEPQVLEYPIAQRRNHLAMPLVVVVVVGTVDSLGGGSTTGAPLPRSRGQNLSQRTQLRDREAGVTSTEVRNARNSSRVTPRTN